MRKLTVALCALAVVSVAVAQDPSSVPVQIYESIEKAFATATGKADAELDKAKELRDKAVSTAATTRLAQYQEKLKEVTKTGDFDKATGIKARIQQLEQEPELAAETKSKKPRPKDAVKFAGHWYALIKEPATWHVAKQRCEDMGGHLAVFESLREAEFVAHLAGKENAWVGATDEEQEGKWVWVNGHSGIMPPNGINGDNGLSHCLMWFEGKWHDATSGTRFAYVCEWDH